MDRAGVEAALRAVAHDARVGHSLFVPAGAMAKGGTWTGIMILTYMFALMGIHSSPAFSMWAFANKNPRPFPLQQVWASTAGIGFALIIFTTLQAMTRQKLRTPEDWTSWWNDNKKKDWDEGKD